MVLGAGMSCVKYLLFCFNLLFAITGIALFVTGIVTQIKSHPYINLSDSNIYTTGPIALVIVGVIVFIVAFFGCCGAVKENHCMIMTFAILLLGIFVVEVAVGVASYVKDESLNSTIYTDFNSRIKSYNTDPNVKATFDIIQTDFHCCGITQYQDWMDNGMQIPSSCCKDQEIIDGAVETCTPDSIGFHKEACLPIIVDVLRKISMVLGGIGIGVAMVQLLGVIFACCLARSIRNQYETV